MSPRLLLCAVALVWGTTSYAQNKPGDKTPKSNASQAVSPDDLVIQIANACQTPPGEFAVRDCIRGVTREEFEDLVAATNPNAGHAERQKLAEDIGRLLIFSNEARKRGLPRDPKIHELLRLLQAQELANLLLSQTEKEAAASVTDDDVNSFYRAHLADYESAELIRLSIPRKNPGSDSPEDTAYAESLRTRCAAGEDPAKLQAESLQRVSRGMVAPEVLKNQKRSQLGESAQLIFGIKPGECMTVADSNAETHLYKMVAATTQPMAEVHDVIVKAIQKERVKEDLGAVAKEHPIRLNDKYFSTTTAASQK